MFCLGLFPRVDVAETGCFFSNTEINDDLSNAGVPFIVFLVVFAIDVYIWIIVVAFYREKPVERSQEQSV